MVREVVRRGVLVPPVGRHCEVLLWAGLREANDAEETSLSLSQLTPREVPGPRRPPNPLT